MFFYSGYYYNFVDSKLNVMENKKYRAWFESTRESNLKTIAQTETIFEGLVLKIASGAMAISFSFITALAPKIEYRFLWVLAVGWTALAICIIWNILSHLKAKRNCQKNIQSIDTYLWGKGNTDSEEEIYEEIRTRSVAIDDKNKKLDNYYNRPTAWLMIGGIAFILGFVFVNIAFSQPEQRLLQEETTSYTISSIEETLNRIEGIQQDTLSNHQIKATL